LSRLPPIDVFQGTHDVFLADARLFRERVLATGGRVNLYEYAGAFHVFVAATFAREAKQALETVAHSLKSMVADRPGTTPGTRGSMFGASF
jgi:acetyl esterase/lipase